LTALGEGDGVPAPYALPITSLAPQLIDTNPFFDDT